MCWKSPTACHTAWIAVLAASLLAAEVSAQPAAEGPPAAGPQVPEADAPPAVPDPDAPESDVPESDVPESDVPRLPPTTVVGEPTPGPAPAPAPVTATATVVTPTGTTRELREIGSSVTVIDSEQFLRRDQVSVAEVLRGVPGVDVVQLGGPGGLSSVFIRGASSQNTKVLLDGIPLNDPSNASRLFDFSNLSVDNIERIEVLRGPQSVLYGSDALGGVINIITRRGSGPLTVRAQAQGGSFGTHRESLQASGGNCRYDYSLAGSYLHTDGFSAADEDLGNTEKDAFDLGTVSGRFGWRPTENLDVDFIFRWADARAEIDDASFSLGTPPTDDPLRRNLSETFYSRLQARWFSPEGLATHTVAFDFTDYDRSDLDDVFPSAFQGQTRKVEWKADLQLGCHNLFTVGADYQDEEAASQSPFGTPSASQFDGGVFVQDQIQLADRWFTTVGARWDDNSAAGPASTYRVASVLNFDETGTALRGSIGTGFRAPALAENLFPFGNPGLLPEESRGWDYGVEQSLFCDRVVLGATYFRNDFRNLILFDPLTLTLDNIGRARTHGVEITGLWYVRPDLLINASYTRTDSRDESTGLQLVRRPRHKGTLAITRQMCCDRAGITLWANVVGDRFDSRDGSVVLDDYLVVNLAGYYNVNDRLRLFGRVDNLFDEQYQEVTGYGTADLSAYGGASLVW